LPSWYNLTCVQARSRYKLTKWRKLVTVQKLAGWQMSVSGCPYTLNLLESRNPAKTVTKK
jgi:hypothetical protein